MPHHGAVTSPAAAAEQGLGAGRRGGGYMERLGIRLPLQAILLVPGSAWAQERVYEWPGGCIRCGESWVSV